MLPQELYLVYDYLQAVLRKFSSPQIVDELMRSHRNQDDRFCHVVPLHALRARHCDDWLGTRPPTRSAAAARAAVASMSLRDDVDDDDKSPTPSSVEALVAEHTAPSAAAPALAAAPRETNAKKSKKKGKVVLFQMSINRSQYDD